jgi:Nuclease-related domain
VVDLAQLLIGHPVVASTAAGTQAWWDRETRTVTCTECWASGGSSSPPIPAPPQLGQPGGSLLREHERRQRNRENRTRKAHPRVGGLLLALGSAPPHESVLAQGAAAERAVADSLAKRTTSDSVITLHNRRMPSGRGDIDHIAIAASGVWVIDTKDWAGKVEIESPWSGTTRLRIRGRDRTRLIDGLKRQITAVRPCSITGAMNGSPFRAPCASPRPTYRGCAPRPSAGTCSCTGGPSPSA